MIPLRGPKAIQKESVMPRGGFRVGAGRKPKPKPVESIPVAAAVKGYSARGKKDEDTPKEWPLGTVPPGSGDDQADEDPATGMPVDPTLTPLEIMQRIARNPKADIRVRLQASIGAAPYLHSKIGEAKPKKPKESAQSKYVAGAPPLRVVG